MSAAEGQINIVRDGTINCTPNGARSYLALVPVAQVERDEPLRFDDDPEFCLLLIVPLLESLMI